MASYRSPIGRLASLPVGADQEIRTPKGVRSFELIERAALHPALSGAEWDSINTVLQSLDFGPLTVVSLKELLRTVAPGDDIDLLDSLLAEGRAADNVLEGLRRSAIMKMGLRDQPLLDQYQDEIYGEVTDQRIRKVLDQPPPKGFARWNGPLIARALGDVDVQYVWRSLRKQKIDVAGRKSWCESNDPDFAAKAADVVGLYMAPPKNAIVLCVDEKPSIQALERAQGYLKLPNGRALTGHSHDYKRHGTTTLFAAFEVATGKVRAAHKKRRRRKEFLDFMDEIVADYPKARLKVILDNLNTHKKNDEWLKRHPLVTFHFTPTRASWLNQVECWFSILQGQSLNGASFTSVDQVKKHIDAFIKNYNEDAEPFVWTKSKVHQRRVKGRRLSDL